MPPVKAASLVSGRRPRRRRARLAAPFFDRIATFPVALNLPDGADPATVTSAEIVAASGDGMTLVYTDSPNKRDRLHRHRRPGRARAARQPRASTASRPPSPIRDATAFVGVNTRAELHRALRPPRRRRHRHPRRDRHLRPRRPARLGRRRARRQIRRGRDRERARRGGERRRHPAAPRPAASPSCRSPTAPCDCAAIVRADLTGLADDRARGPRARVRRHQRRRRGRRDPAGEQPHRHPRPRPARCSRTSPPAPSTSPASTPPTTARSHLTGSQTGVPREPDAVQWIGTDRLATANEGDWQGGSRGFTIFGRDGSVAFESGAGLRAARSPRSATIPRAAPKPRASSPRAWSSPASATTDYLFVLSERASSSASTASRTATPSPAPAAALRRLARGRCSRSRRATSSSPPTRSTSSRTASPAPT